MTFYKAGADAIVQDHPGVTAWQRLGFVVRNPQAVLDSGAWAISSVGERFPHTEEATGSIPVSPTTSPFST